MSSTELHTDHLVIGAGVIGLAIAKRLSDSGKECFVVEKNGAFGEETSSRNSEVIHAGIYYPQNSLKAKLCIEGKTALYQYCQSRNLPHQQLGKLIVATSKDEESQLDLIEQKAINNGVTDLNWLNHQQLKTIEPNVKSTAALLSPSTGIVDVHQYMLSLVGDIEDAGNPIVYYADVHQIEQTSSGWKVRLFNQGEELSIHCRWLINAAGLHANKLAAMYQTDTPKLHFCRGLYFSYSGKNLFKHLIYPVPEKNTVGLGIHATLDLAGQVKFGPDTHYLDSIDYSFPEGSALLETRQRWAKAIQSYYPDIEIERLTPSYAGIRPKLSGAKGAAKDFVIEGPNQHDLDNLIHLLGIESPGLTSSLAIAKYVETLINESDH